MPHEAPSPIGPDAPDALEPQFRIEGALAVRAVLRELMTRRTLVTIYPENRIDDALVTRIVHVDTDGVEFDASGQARSAQALREARFATGVSFPENVKTQFRLEPLTLEEGSAPLATGNPTPGSDWTTLHAPVPSEVYRLQRRDAFRVRPPVEDDAHCVQRLGVGRELRHPLIDLSAGGLSIRMSAEEAAPSRGRIWRHSRIEAAEELVIPCELVVRGVYEDPALEGARRIAFAFHAMPSEVLRRVQMYVIDIEKRLRHE
jgi:c-di-GMP-binding flagellar brake protein YcgR